MDYIIKFTDTVGVCRRPRRTIELVINGDMVRMNCASCGRPSLWNVKYWTLSDLESISSSSQETMNDVN